MTVLRIKAVNMRKALTTWVVRYHSVNDTGFVDYRPFDRGIASTANHLLWLYKNCKGDFEVNAGNVFFTSEEDALLSLLTHS